jgi:1,4-alpha-glucan branching enzyme
MKVLKSSPSKNNSTANVRVQFEYVDHQAQTVCIAGSFNNWHPNATPMISCGPGLWRKELVLPPGIYEYALVVDNQWKPDPKCTERIENPFGGLNSVLNVTPRGRWLPS